MAARGKISRLESEIEKCRVEGDWYKVSELVKQLSTKSPGLGIVEALKKNAIRISIYSYCITPSRGLRAGACLTYSQNRCTS